MRVLVILGCHFRGDQFSADRLFILSGPPFTHHQNEFNNGSSKALMILWCSPRALRSSYEHTAWEQSAAALQLLSHFCVWLQGLSIISRCWDGNVFWFSAVHVDIKYPLVSEQEVVDSKCLCKEVLPVLSRYKSQGSSSVLWVRGCDLRVMRPSTLAMHCGDAEFNGFLGVFALFLQTFPPQPDI